MVHYLPDVKPGDSGTLDTTQAMIAALGAQAAAMSSMAAAMDAQTAAINALTKREASAAARPIRAVQVTIGA